MPDVATVSLHYYALGLKWFSEMIKSNFPFRCSFLTLNSGPYQTNPKNQLMHFTGFIRTSQQNVINENYGKQPCPAKTLSL